MNDSGSFNSKLCSQQGEIMKKKDRITFILTESQYNDPMMQELIQKAEGVEIISDEEFEKMIQEMEPVEDPLLN